MSVPVHAYAINPGPAGWFMRRLRRQRGRMCILGNSNEFFNTSSAGGRLRAMYIKAAAAGIPIYSTPAMTLAGTEATSGAPERSAGFISQSYPTLTATTRATALATTSTRHPTPAPALSAIR